jgi:hypothetical protein
MTTNPNNYEGAQVTIVGRAGGPPVAVFDGSTTRLSVAVGQGYKKDGEWVDTGTTWYTVQASTEYVEQNWPDIDTGDKVRIDDAKQETRLYTKGNGDPGLEVKLTYGRVSLVDRKAERASSGSKPF